MSFDFSEPVKVHPPKTYGFTPQTEKKVTRGRARDPRVPKQRDGVTGVTGVYLRTSVVGANHFHPLEQPPMLFANSRLFSEFDANTEVVEVLCVLVTGPRRVQSNTYYAREFRDTTPDGLQVSFSSRADTV